MKSILIFSAIFAMGCGGWNRGDICHIHIEDGFSSDQISLIKESSNDWSNALDGYIEFEYDSTPSYYDHLMNIHPTLMETLRSEHSKVIVGWTSYYSIRSEGGFTEISVDIPNKDFGLAIKHEMGHVLGLTHTGVGTIMAPLVGEMSERVTQTDVDQFYQHWGI